MMLPAPLEQQLRNLLIARGVKPGLPLSCRAVSGGSINQAASVHSGEVTLFVKWNHADRYPGMFEAEAKGLNLLRNPGGAMVPEVLETGTAGDMAYLAMEYVGRGPDGGLNPDDSFGAMLAALHRNSAAQFGLDHDNYMGSLPQSNRMHQSWNEFFIHERLLPQLKIARDEGSLGSSESHAFDLLFKRLPEIIPEEAPALVHGDLWSGNYLTGSQGQIWLIDPAVAYGHREVDIAMSKLFGGFPATFYEAYSAHFPLIKGWESRIEIFQLYPLLIHVNLFGGGYIDSVKRVIQRFG
jgi:protein-ribulosamine 3-kinase